MPSCGRSTPRSTRREQRRHVRARPPAVRPDDPEPASYEPRDLDACTLADRCDADRDHTAAVTQHLDGLQERLRTAQDLEGDVDTAVRHREDALDGVLRRTASTRSVAPSDGGGPQLQLAEVDGDDLSRALRACELHDQRAHTPGTDDDDPLAERELRRVAHGAVRRERRAAEDRSVFQRRCRPVARRPRWRAAPRTPPAHPSSTWPAGCRQRGRGGSLRRRARHGAG